MKFFFILLALVLALPAQATTYKFDMLFKGDSALQLHYGYSGEVCSSRSDCYPDDFRLPNGTFAELEMGQRTTAILDMEAGTAKIADWDVPGELSMSDGFMAQFLTGVPTGSTLFTNERISVMDEGPAGTSPIAFCDPSAPAPGLPSGFCGFFGYQADFEVLSVTAVPLPASALMLLSALGLLGAARKMRSA